MHLFLTGPRGAGKSTLLNAVAEAFSGKTGGFRTVQLNTYLPDTYTVHMFLPGRAQAPSQENLLFVCGRKKDDADRFDRLGCQALTQKADLLLMDELGPHEAEAAAFQKAVLTALEGDTPVLGVLQEGEYPFGETIAGHKNVALIRLTEENRQELHRQIPALCAILKGEEP